MQLAASTSELRLYAGRGGRAARDRWNEDTAHLAAAAWLVDAADESIQIAVRVQLLDPNGALCFAEPHSSHMRVSQSVTAGAVILRLSEVLTVRSPSDLPSEVTTSGGCVAVSLHAEVSPVFDP